jgi:hypothetical protein
MVVEPEIDHGIVAEFMPEGDAEIDIEMTLHR